MVSHQMATSKSVPAEGPARVPRGGHVGHEPQRHLYLATSRCPRRDHLGWRMAQSAGGLDPQPARAAEPEPDRRGRGRPAEGAAAAACRRRGAGRRQRRGRRTARTLPRRRRRRREEVAAEVGSGGMAPGRATSLRAAACGRRRGRSRRTHHDWIVRGQLPLKLIVGLGNPGRGVRAHAPQRRLLVRRPAGARAPAAVAARRATSASWRGSRSPSTKCGCSSPRPT